MDATMALDTRKICLIMLYVSLFYVISLTLGFFSSYVYSKKNYNFRFPLFITSMQNILHFLFATVCIRIIRRLFQSSEAIDNPEDGFRMVNKEHPDSKNPCSLLRNVLITPKNQVWHSDRDSLVLKKYKNTDYSLKRSSSSPSIHRFKVEPYYGKLDEQLPATAAQTSQNTDFSQARTRVSDKIDCQNSNKSLIEVGIKSVPENKSSKMVYVHTPRPFYKVRRTRSLNTLEINIFHKILKAGPPLDEYNISGCNLHNQDMDEPKVDQEPCNDPKNENHREYHFLGPKKNCKSSQAKMIRTRIIAYVATTLTCAITAAIDIGLSSHALRTVSLAFYTMIKSSAPVFVLLSGFLFGIEQPSIKLFLTIFTIGAGVFLTTVKADTVTHTVNLCLNVTTFSLFFASFMGGFRWAFVQYLIEKRRVAKRSVLYTVQELCLPISILLFIFSCYFEGIKNILTSEFFRTRMDIQRNVGFILLSGFLSFCLLVSEFLLVSETSVVFLSVSGIVKELIIVFVSVCKKEIKFDPINYGGLTVSILGMLFYNVLLVTRRQRNESQG